MRDGFGLSWIVSKQRGEGAGVREPGEEGGSVSTILAVDLALGLLAGFLCVRGRMRMMEYWVDDICRDMDCNRGRTTTRCGFRKGGGGSRKGRRIGGLLFLYALLLLGMLLVAEILVVASAERLDYVDFFEERKKEAEELVNATTRLNNATTEARPPSSREGSIAEVFDELLEREFPEKEDPQEANEGLVGSSFNNSVNDQQAVLETVARVTHDKPKKNDTQAENTTAKPFHLQDLIINRDAETGADQLPTLIDKKDNVFVISNPREGSMVLQQDVRFISDLVLVIVSAAGGGIAFACLGQPVITGYLLAGSAVGPGGFSFVSELVQVETVAQFGVVFLLFALGLEFSMSKLRVVRAVAVIGGFLQIALFMCLCSLTAVLCGAKASEGIFVGAFLSMSSTAVVLKFLMDRNGTTALHGQVTIGTLILQDCAVGLLFALLPVLGDTGGVMSGLVAMSRSLFVLAAFIVTAVIVTRSLVTRFFKLISSQTNELYQLASVAFCLLVAWISDKLGLSLELGAFVAGVMISTTEFAEHTLEQVEPIRNLFASLFLASIGMLINIQFLWAHMDILVASLILVIVSKTIVVTVVVRAFGYSMKNAFLVGMSLAQIGEFAFILLSRASNLHLIQKKLYLLLVGTTALSLVTTPLLFRAIPAVLHLGSLMRWIPPDSNQSEVRNVVQCLSYARGAGEENGMVKQNEQKWSSSSCCASMWLSIKEGSQWKRAQRRQACSSTTPNST